MGSCVTHVGMLDSLAPGRSDVFVTGTKACLTWQATLGGPHAGDMAVPYEKEACIAAGRSGMPNRSKWQGSNVEGVRSSTSMRLHWFWVPLESRLCSKISLVPGAVCSSRPLTSEPTVGMWRSLNSGRMSNLCKLC